MVAVGVGVGVGDGGVRWLSFALALVGLGGRCWVGVSGRCLVEVVVARHSVAGLAAFQEGGDVHVVHPR